VCDMLPLITSFWTLFGFFTFLKMLHDQREHGSLCAFGTG